MATGSKLPRDEVGVRELSLHAIARWRLVALGFAGLLALAAAAWAAIPRLDDPVVEPAEAGVVISYPGASPEDVEAQVVQPVEAALYGLPGVQTVESSALPNLATFHLTFEDGTDMDATVERARAAALAKKKDLPPEVEEPSAFKYTTAMTAQMVLAVVGARADGVLTDAAERLKSEISLVPGVAQVKLRGAGERRVRVRLDPARLAAHGLTLDEVVERLRAANVRAPAGELRVRSLATLVQVGHPFDGAEAVRLAPVGASADARGAARPLTLGDVAEVREDDGPRGERFFHDGLPAVGLEVYLRKGENAIAVGRRVRARAAAAGALLPPGARVEVSYDQPESIERSLSSFVRNLLEGVLLVAAVITLGIGWRPALVVVAVLPLATGGALLALYAFGFALDQVSIAGLIVALGLLVDDAVVVTESIQLMRDRGLSALRAAVLGTARVFSANNGTTAVACASFLPLFFMGGNVGSYIRGLPTAVVAAMVTSLLVAQLLTPWLATLLLRPAPGAAPIDDGAPFDRAQDTAPESHGEANVALRALKAGFARAIPAVTARPFAVVAGATALLVACVALLPRLGFQFFPKADKPVLFVTVELPPGTDLAITADKAARIAEAIRQDPGVAFTSGVVGAGYPDVFVGRASKNPNSAVADILVRRAPDVPSDELAARLRARVGAFAGAFVRVEELYNGPPLAHPIMLRLHGEDYGKLRALAEEVKTLVRARPGAVNVSDNLSPMIPLTRVRIDGERAERAGVAPAQAATTLRWLYGEDKVTEFRRGANTVRVSIEGARGADPIGRLAETPVRARGGGVVPLRAVAEVARARGASELRRHNARRIVEVTADVTGDALAERILGEVGDALAKKEWERGYGFAYAGEQQETEKSFANLAIAALSTLIVIFFLLVLMLDSLRLSAVVMAAVPYALVGAVAGLGLARQPFGFMAFLGLIALTGVYVNHKIYFVDRARELMRRGYAPPRALAQAGLDRLRPVVLTALTAVLGLLPLTLWGGPLWTSFGWVNIFGLLFSIPLSLILLPAFMTLVYRIPSRPLRRAAAGRPEHPVGTMLALLPAGQQARRDRDRQAAEASSRRMF